jgi:hypothetical protein
MFGHAGISWAVRIGTFKELKSFHGVKSRSHAELIAEAEQAFAAARRLVDEQSAIVQRLERTGGCNRTLASSQQFAKVIQKIDGFTLL